MRDSLGPELHLPRIRPRTATYGTARKDKMSPTIKYQSEVICEEWDEEANSTLIFLFLRHLCIACAHRNRLFNRNLVPTFRIDTTEKRRGVTRTNLIGTQRRVCSE